MDRISDIALQNTVTVKVDCQLNSEVVGRNFQIIMDCLRELKTAQDGYNGRLGKLEDRLSSVEKNNSSAEQQLSKSKEDRKEEQSDNTEKEAAEKGGISQVERDNILQMIKELGDRTSNNEKNILDNIKDINLLNKDVIGLKEAIQKLKTASNTQGRDSGSKGGIEMGAEAITNINNEVLRNREETDKLREQLEKLNNQVSSLREKLEQLIKDSQLTSNNTVENADSSNNNNNSNGGGGEVTRAEFNQLKEKVGIVQKKTAGLQMITDDLGKGQKELQESDEQIIKEIEELKALIEKLKKQAKGSRNQNNAGDDGVSKADWRHLQKLIEQLRKDLDSLKKEQNGQSKTSIEDQSGTKSRLDKASYTQVRFRDDDKLKQLIARVDYLQKMMGSKNSIDQDGNRNEKLPLIKRPTKPRDTAHDKSSVKKDMYEIKNELQAWLNNYLANLKSKDNFEDLELKIQQIKNALGKKADQQGMKKGLMFLESKINQLYLFLTEPDGEDAMIVRKGFNCLSCSKKVEKLRGKLGPHINWNNMTSTSYSPPKVGYSRQHGDSPEREDDL